MYINKCNCSTGHTVLVRYVITEEQGKELNGLIALNSWLKEMTWMELSTNIRNCQLLNSDRFKQLPALWPYKQLLLLEYRHKTLLLKLSK